MDTVAVARFRVFCSSFFSSSVLLIHHARTPPRLISRPICSLVVSLLLVRYSILVDFDRVMPPLSPRSSSTPLSDGTISTAAKVKQSSSSSRQSSSKADNAGDDDRVFSMYASTSTMPNNRLLWKKKRRQLKDALTGPSRASKLIRRRNSFYINYAGTYTSHLYITILSCDFHLSSCIY